MENNLNSNVTTPQSTDRPQAFPSVHYLAAAPLMEVMFEQLEYLGEHLTNGEECPSTCALCARLNEVSRYLLSPFHNPLNG